jgi:hypothetical protein
MTKKSTVEESVSNRISRRSSSLKKVKQSKIRGIRGALSGWKQNLGRLAHIFVAAAAQVGDEEGVFGHGGGDFDDMGDGVGGFEGGDDAFDFG